MSERVLQGPFLTRAQASRRARVPARILVHRPDLLSVNSPWLQEAYFAFQFDAHGVRPDVGFVVQHLKGRSSDVDIADWLVRPNRTLNDAAPLAVLDAHATYALDRVIDAADQDGPIPEDLWEEVLRVADTDTVAGLPSGPPAVASGADRRNAQSRSRAGRPSRSAAHAA